MDDIFIVWKIMCLFDIGVECWEVLDVVIDYCVVM